MADVEVLDVGRRELRGKLNNRRLRASGKIPAVLYGHGQESVSLSIATDQLQTALRRGTKLVELQGDVTDTALISEVQWDAFGSEVLHLDLTRVSKTERVEVAVSLELRGSAPGEREGGVTSLQLHSVDIICPAVAIPEHIDVNINQLELGQSITAADLELPEKAELVTPSEALVVQCVEPTADTEEEEVSGLGEGVEPEVIGRPEGESSEEGQ